MGRSSTTARKAQPASPQVPPVQVPSQASDVDSQEPGDIHPESAHSVTETDNADTASAEPVSDVETDQPSDPSTEDPIVVDESVITVPAGELSLDDDPDTALVGNIYLHLLSEHGLYAGLRLSDDAAVAQHAYIHDQGDFDHAVDDWRFRPLKALSASLLAVTAAEEVQPEADPVPAP